MEQAADERGLRMKGRRRRRMGPRPERAPESWSESAALAAATVGFTYAETIGKWGIGGLVFGIKNHMRRQEQDNQQFEKTYAGKDCKRLKGPEITAKLIHLLNLLNNCMMFTRKSLSRFLKSSGYSREDLIFEEHKAGILKPNFAVIRDRNCQCFLLFIRGALSIKDRLTAATGEMVPFHHISLQDGRVDRLVLGYAHCGMLAAARWIAKRVTPSLLQAICQNPDYKIKIIGHSMGAGIAAMLTYILREREELSSSTCITYGPASCMTWELAESGRHFVTSIVNCTDMVPTFQPASASDLRAEIQAASNRSQENFSCTSCFDLVHQSASTPEGNTQIHAGASTNCFSFIHWPFMGIYQKSTTKRISDSAVSEVNDDQKVVKVDFCYSTFQNQRKPMINAKDHIVNCSASEKEEELISEVQVLEESPEIRQHTLLDALERHQFYPPGKMMHMVVLPASDANSRDDIGIFETPKELYSKIRLAETMILDHYMEGYIKTMEQLIDRLKEDDDMSPSSSSPSSIQPRDKIDG